MIFHWSLSDKKSPQVIRTLLSILAGLNNDVAWILSTRRFICNSSTCCTNPLVTIPRAPITIRTTITFTFHTFFFQFPSKVLVIIFFFNLFQFYSVVRWDSEVHNSASSLCLLLIITGYYYHYYYCLLIYLFTIIFFSNLVDSEWL